MLTIQQDSPAMIWLLDL